jgi:hypothetical protein
MSLAAILKRLDAIEAKLNPNRGAGQWVRGLGGAVVWDPTDLDAPPETDPLPLLIDAMDRTAERLRAEPGWREPTDAQRAEGRMGLEECIERYRAERQAIRDFSAAHQAVLDGRPA